MAGRRSAAVFCATVAANLQTSVPASICGQVPAVLRKPFLLGLRQTFLRGCGHADHPRRIIACPLLCQLAPRAAAPCCSFASWLADRPVAATRHKRAASGPFSGAATQAQSGFSWQDCAT